MKIFAVKTPIIQSGQLLEPILAEALPRPLQERDILCVASKVVAMEQGRLVDLFSVEPSPAARAMHQVALSKDPETYARLGELVLHEADQIFDADQIWLTVKDHIFVANAGIDMSNVPAGTAVLWPVRPWEWAADFQRRLCARYGLRELGVVVTDSRCIPLRRGVTGVSVAFAGIEGIDNLKGKPDIFGRLLQYTEKCVADDLASAAVLVSGEADERTPFVVIEDAPVTFTDRVIDPSEVVIDPAVDLFAGIYNETLKRWTPRG